MVNINCKSCKNLSIVVTTINSNNSYECNNHENRKMTLNKSNEKQSNIPLYKHSFHLGHSVRITEINNIIDT